MDAKDRAEGGKKGSTGLITSCMLRPFVSALSLRVLYYLRTDVTNTSSCVEKRQPCVAMASGKNVSIQQAREELGRLSCVELCARCAQTPRYTRKREAVQCKGADRHGIKLKRGVEGMLRLPFVPTVVWVCTQATSTPWGSSLALQVTLAHKLTERLRPLAVRIA